MKISTEICSISRFVGEEEAIRLLAAAGFEAWDFSMFDMATYNYSERRITDSDHPLHGAGYRSFAKRLYEVSRECGVVCNQSHAPFPTYCPEMLDYLLRAIECTAIAGGKVCVIHPDNLSDADKNLALYEKLLPFAKECGVKIATENTFRVEVKTGRILPCCTSDHSGITGLLDLINDPYLVACLDIGHAELDGLSTSACEMIRALGADRLAALHVHDNDKCHDSHLLPFTDALEWEPIAAALAEIGYRGDVTLEGGNYAKRFTADTAPECAGAMAAAANRLRDMILARQR
ncbi:MAG: sugar phosphate isomerase/epimerase [Clostridia bacterium]|nr:sugar phosphate isomerase/epimerase [Clostridia bacterium]